VAKLISQRLQWSAAHTARVRLYSELGHVTPPLTPYSLLLHSLVRASTPAALYMHAKFQVSELAAERKLMKYSNLPTNLIFQPIAVENLGPFSSSSSDFISALGHRISSVSGEERETSFLHSCSSICLLHCNDSMQFCCTTPSCPRTIRTDSHSSSVFIAFYLWELYTQGY